MSTIHKVGRLYGEKIEYSDGIGCCVWQPLPDDPDPESGGTCWDFSFENIDDLIKLLNELKEAPADIFEEDR